jgi:hypothetical protein
MHLGLAHRTTEDLQRLYNAFVVRSVKVFGIGLVGAGLAMTATEEHPTPLYIIGVVLVAAALVLLIGLVLAQVVIGLIIAKRRLL